MATDPMTAPDLDALAGLLEKATPRPWRRGGHGHFGGAGWTAVVMDDEGPGEAVIARAEQVSVDDPCRAEQKANAALIAAAVNALPALLATARRERRMREALVAARAHVALDDAMHDYNPFHEEGEGLDEHDPDACAACMRDAALIAIDAALAEEGQDG